MAPQCAICLSDLRNPVTTPCGHVFCSECLMRATARATDGFHTSCPCCRKRFPIAVPDVRYLPAQFRPFVLDPIRSIYFATDDPHDRSDIIQRNESLERENELLRARVQELEADSASSHPGNEEEGSDPQEIDTPVFLDHPDPDLVLSEVTSNSPVPLYVATNSAYPRSAPLFRPETQFIPPPHPIHTGPARSFAPVSVMGLNRLTSGQTISRTFTFSRSETRPNYSTASAHPTGPVRPTPSNMGNVLVPGPRTFIINLPESHHSTPSIPAPRWGAGPSSGTVRPTSSGNTGNISFSHPGAQWTVPSNFALNIPNQSASSSVSNATGPGYFFSRRESHPRMATPATLGPGLSETNSTTDDVPNSSASGSESRRPSQSS